jgi:hypothetical protein
VKINNLDTYCEWAEEVRTAAKMRTSRQSHDRKRQTTERHGDHCRIVGLQRGTCFMLPSGAWNLEVASRILENFWTSEANVSSLQHHS